MSVVSVNTVHCYGRVNHVMMSLVLICLALISHIVIAALLSYLQTTRFVQRTRFGDSTLSLGIDKLETYLMGLGHGSLGAVLDKT